MTDGESVGWGELDLFTLLDLAFSSTSQNKEHETNELFAKADRYFR